MTRRRRFPLVSRVCIGTFLLLFSIATTDTIKGPSTTLEKVHFPETETIFQKNRTILKKVPADESELVSAENDQSVDLINAEDQDVGKSIKAQDEEKVPTSKDHKVQGIRSHDEVDRLSTSDSTSGSRFEEILYGTSGKSSSTKAISEDFYRLPRTNGLTTVTTKPAFEDSRLEEKKNKTIINPSQQVENNTNYLTNGSKLALENTFKEEKQETDKKGLQRTLILESKNSYLSSNVDDHGDRESTTQRSIREAFDEKEKEDSYSKNSEVTDLKSIAEKNGNGEPISLINDTYVNYSHYYKTSTEKNLEASSGNQSRVSKNGTNFISKDSGVSHEWQDPKEEVEVVRNVTHTPIERLVDEVRNLERSQNTSRREDANFDNELNDKRSKDNIITYNATKVKENEAETEKQESLSEIHHLKPMGNTTLGSNENIKDEGQTPLPLNNSNPVARGRTIAFSGINEFPDLETKTTATSKEIDVPLLKKNISIEKTIEQKPYPYVKSTMEPVLVRNSSNRVIEHTTEETSAYENTIERGRSEEKFVVTEPSVVIENSIQQFKPTYYDKLKNESLNNSTTQSSSPMTTLSSALEDVKPTNQTLVHQSYDLKTTEKRLQEQSINPENDVPGGNEGSQVITEKENFDVTGNGITEVSLKPEISDNANKRTTQRSYELSFHAEITNRTTLIPVTSDFTEKPKTEAKIISNMDVQQSSEESLLTRSTLNVTEASTEYSLTKENSTENEKSTTLFSLPLNYTVAKIPESTTMTPTILTHEIAKANVSSPRTVDTNGTNEIPSGVSITSNPEENSLPTTTSVEYEFVGLTEATILPNENITEAPQHPEGQAEITTTMTPVSTVKDIMTKNSSEEVSTIGPENVTDNSPTSESEKDDDIDRLSTTPIIDQTTIPTSMPGPTTLKDFTISSITEEQTDQTTREEDIKKTTIVIDTWSTTSDEDIVTGMSTEVLFDSSSAKDSNLIPNVTEVPVTESVSILNITTDTTRETTLIDSLPSTLHPKILAESTKSTPSTSEMPIDRTTDVSLMSLSPDEIKSLVRIVMKGTWLEVCRHMETLRVTLAEILKSGMNKSVYANQIRFHQNPCLEPPTQTPMPTDMPLTSVLVYVVDENGKFDSSMTSILPSLYNDSRDSFPVTENDSGNAIVVIVVSSVAFICLVLLAGLLFIMRKRQTRFNYGERCRPVSLDAYSLDSVSAYNSVRRKDVARSSKRSYGNPTFEDSSAIPSHPLNFAGLSSFCNDVNAINEEFSGIPQVSAKIDELPSGAEVKNRYANVIPLPETRVPLQKMNNDPLTEYINASYVRGPKNATRYYIACQGPMETTVTDFWRMIWEQQCKVIIMLTDLVENGVEKCTEYIPPSEVTDCHRLYGDYQVTLKKRETKEKYAISTLHLKNLENNTFREIYHIWYLWPVNGVQSDGAGLIAVLLEARALQRGGPGPIVVHCSPGTGRTGTLITLDLGIRQYEITRTVDVPRVVYTIRRDRAGAVQTKEQYAFIYKALNLYATKLAGGVLEST